MTGTTRLRALDQFDAVVSSNGGLVITDSVRPPIFHPSSRDCPHVQPAHFMTKVLANAERNGSYFLVSSLAAAQEEWPQVRLCQSDACCGADPAGGPLEWALREATGIDAVRARSREPVGAEAMPPDWESTQRLALGHSGGRLILRTWPGELQAQARAFYGSDRPRLLSELTETSDWDAAPLPHLAYNNARPQDRFYFSSPLPLDRYASFWSQSANLARVGAYPLESIETDLWPWLCACEIGDAGKPEDLAELDRFIERLARRRAEALLRPSVEVTRTWDLQLEDDPSALLREVRTAVEQVAEVLRENLPRG